MKKIHILIPSLVATASMPLISLVGCNNNQNKPIPIPEDAVIVYIWNNGFEGASDPGSGEPIVTGGILSSKRPYQPDTEYLFAVKFSGKEKFIEVNPKYYFFQPSEGFMQPDNDFWFFNDVEIYINNVDNKLVAEQDYKVEDNGRIRFYYSESQRIQGINDGDIVFIKTKLTSESEKSNHFAFFPSPV